MTELVLMTQPRAEPDPLVPRILLEENGLWRDTGDPSRGSLQGTRAKLTAAMARAVAPGAGGVNDPIAGLEGYANTLYGALASDVLIERLSEAADQAAPDDPPLLRIHVTEGHEWIPWEVLHDGTGFLGLRFRITRLPITRQPPDQPEDCLHDVRRVHSLLGRGVTTDDTELATWRGTFEDLLPPDVEAALLPPGDEDTGWPERSSMFRDPASLPDILHITCHGVRDEDLGSVWTLNPDNVDGSWAFTVDAEDVTSMAEALSATRPLVFGNACGGDAVDADDTAGSQAVPTAFFSNGALNVVGSFAPIRRTMALRFARHFYERLLRHDDSVAAALCEAKRHFWDTRADDQDASFLFYCLYGPPDTRYSPANGGPA